MRIYPGMIVMALLILSFSCKKDELETIRVKGVIVDSYTHGKIQGASLSLLSIRIEGGVYHSTYTNIATTHTDAEGKFAFEVATQKAISYRIQVDADGYFSQHQDFDPFAVTKNEALVADFEVVPGAWLRLRVENVSPWDANDLISFSIDGFVAACSDCCGTGTIKGEGPIFNYNKICRIPAGQMLKLKWTVTKANNTFLHQDSLFLTPFDTAHYQINY